MRLKAGLKVEAGDIITSDMVEEVVVKPQSPEKLAEIDLKAVEKICQDYVDYCVSDEYHEDNDYKQYIFETAVEAVFGQEIWDFLNKINQ